VWISIFTQTGWLNSILQTIGIIDRPIVAGLQSIPPEYLEAAEVYGATTWQKVRHVILPMLRPALQVALILRTILAFQVFATVIALAGTAAVVLAQEARRWATSIDNDNVAAAYAALILFLSIGSTLLFLWLLPTREEQLA
jgi:multiple sugar transport system permease protein